MNKHTKEPKREKATPEKCPGTAGKASWGRCEKPKGHSGQCTYDPAPQTEKATPEKLTKTQWHKRCANYERNSSCANSDCPCVIFASKKLPAPQTAPKEPEMTQLKEENTKLRDAVMRKQEIIIGISSPENKENDDCDDCKIEYYLDLCARQHDEITALKRKVEDLEASCATCKDTDRDALKARVKDLEAELKKKDERLKALEKCNAFHARCDNCPVKSCILMYEVMPCEDLLKKQAPKEADKPCGECGNNHDGHPDHCKDNRCPCIGCNGKNWIPKPKDEPRHEHSKKP